MPSRFSSHTPGRTCWRTLPNMQHWYWLSLTFSVDIAASVALARLCIAKSWMADLTADSATVKPQPRPLYPLSQLQVYIAYRGGGRHSTRPSPLAYTTHRLNTTPTRHASDTVRGSQ